VKILYLGEIRSGQTALMRMREIVRLGHTVCGVCTMEPWKRGSWIKRPSDSSRIHSGGDQLHNSASGALIQAGSSVGGQAKIVPKKSLPQRQKAHIEWH
jgi:hypothetical protein